MKQNPIATLCALLLLVCGSARLVSAAEEKSMAVRDEATQKRIDGKADRLLRAINVEDPQKAERVRQVLGDWFVTMWDWHAQHDAELADLWKQWNAARAVVPKDEFPGEVIATQIEAVYQSLVPAYEAFMKKLSAELTEEQIDTLKETWSRNPGMKRTYNAFLEIVPDLTEEQKQVIYDRMLRAREAAMLTDSDKEIVNIYKRHKVKAEQYVGSLQWAKLHRAYANRGKAPTTAPAGQ